MAAQKADIIYYEGEKRELFSNPLEEYWTKRKKKRPAFFALDVCRRGYVASWEIRDQQLFITDLDGEITGGWLFGKRKIQCTLKSIFKKAGETGVKADWFSGKLRIPTGTMTQYEHNGYDSRFEREVIITIDRGNMIKVATLDYTQRTLVVS